MICSSVKKRNSLFENPSINPEKYVGSYELKRDHACGYTPPQVVLKQPHAWITNYKTSLPSHIVFEVLLNHALDKTFPWSLLSLKPRHGYITP